jgi:hypothetical protein
MLPRFNSELSLDNADRTKVLAAGPFELAGNEKDAYFWLRVSQKKGRGEIDAIGTLSIEKPDLTKEFKAATARMKAAIAEAVAGTDGLSATLASKQIREATIEAAASTGPTWGPAEIQGENEFRTGAATAEAWLMIRTTHDPPQVFQTYWTSDVTLTSQDSV